MLNYGNEEESSSLFIHGSERSSSQVSPLAMLDIEAPSSIIVLIEGSLIQRDVRWTDQYGNLAMQ